MRLLWDQGLGRGALMCEGGMLWCYSNSEEKANRQPLSFDMWNLSVLGVWEVLSLPHYRWRNRLRKG